MHLIVGVKHVPDADTRLRVDPSGTTYDPDGVKFTINNTYDEATLEESLRLKDGNPGTTVHVVSVGPPRAEEGLRAALAMGADEATLVEVRTGTELDPLLTARLLAAVIRGIPHDLVLVGRQAADDEAGQVGSALGHYLGLPSAGYVTGLEVDPASKRLHIKRYVEGGEETLGMEFPAVLSILKGANDPRTPTLPNILKARRKPLRKVPVGDLLPALETWPGGAKPTSRVTAFQLPPPRAGAKILEYTSPEEAAGKLLAALREEAKVL